MYPLCMKDRTTMQVERGTRVMVQKLKKYPRETYDEIIKRLAQARKFGKETQK